MNRSPTKPIRYKLVCEQNVFCYFGFRSYVMANYPKSLPFALKSTFALEIHCKKHLLTPKAKPLEAWRLRRLASLGINLSEIANWDAPCRYIPLTVFRGSRFMLSTCPKATNGGENTTYLPLKTKSALSELLLWPIRRGKAAKRDEFQ